MSWSGAKNYIFKSYICALGKGRLKGIDYRNLKVNITDSNFYAANSARINGIHDINAVTEERLIDYSKLTLGDLKKPYYYNGTTKGKKGKVEYIESRITPTNKYLYNIKIDSFNRDTGITNPDATYEIVKNEACSSRIFSTENDDSWVTKDFDWSLNARNKPSTMNYFAHEYNFNSAYDKTEYVTYGIVENILDENVIRLSAESFVHDDQNNKDEDGNGVMSYGAAGILLTYEDSTKGMTGENELPVAYYDFGNTLHSNYNYIKLDWHEDGVIKVE